MRYLLVFAVLLQSAPLSVRASEAVGAQFLLYEHNARVVGLGGAFVGLADDGDAIYWNPAGLSQLTHTSITLTHHQGFMGVKDEYVNFVRPFGDLGTMGVDFFYSSVEGVDIYDDFGVKAYELENYELVLDAAWGWARSERVALGAGVKCYQSMLAEHFARGIALDIGLLLRDCPVGGSSIGVALQNFGSGITYINVPDPLPLNMKLGPAYRFGVGKLGAVALSVELNHLFHENWTYLNCGMEYGFLGDYFIRGGYRFNRTHDKFSFGFGAGVSNVRVDYALLPFGHLGMAHRISLSYELP